ncbi:NAD(P)-dependent oxidoreductase [Micromonospora zamorensis]|uniref:NAD-dependent epimerase/dehydratase family protein n=1 Tax=Micromonospora zamorensis TaxID=709883 RepID=UPI000C199B5B|nr:NAD(P)-dependent oxidoreductase [Micromonospora zamorensis]WSK49760.1 NAD(P)-dependent oxidoreductase [Micromonospora zamorensis]
MTDEAIDVPISSVPLALRAGGVVTAPAARRVLVLGATGRMGRQLCAAFAADGYEVIAAARGSAGHTAPYRFVPIDVAAANQYELGELLAREGVQVVVNAIAGRGGTAQAMYEANVRPVENLLAALRLVAVDPRLVHVGTILEYGSVETGTSIRENTAQRPDSLYAKSRLACSRLVLTAIRRGEIDGVVVRLAATIGPHAFLESFLGSLALTLYQMDRLAGIDVTLYDARSDYVDVRDAAAAIVRAADCPAADPLVNIGGGIAVEVRALIRCLVRAAGLSPALVRERDEVGWGRGCRWTSLDTSRATGLLGWRPRYTVGESIAAMWESVDGECGRRQMDSASR